MPEQQDTLSQDPVPVEQQSQDATTTNTATTDTSATDATTTTTTDTTTGTQEVVLTQDQYNELVSMGHDSQMIENTLLTVVVGMFLGYIAIRGLFDAWRS